MGTRGKVRVSRSLPERSVEVRVLTLYETEGGSGEGHRLQGEEARLLWQG